VTQATPKAASYSSAYTTPGTQGTNYSTGYTAAAAPTTNTTKGMCHWIIHSYSQFDINFTVRHVGLVRLIVLYYTTYWDGRIMEYVWGTYFWVGLKCLHNFIRMAEG